MACIWYGVQASIGGDCMLVMLRSMWPSVNNIPNHLPESAGITTKGLLGFFLFWFISLPAIWFPIHKVRHLFTLKAIVAPIAGITFFIWCIVKAHGVGPIIHQPSKIHGSELGWEMMNGVMSGLSNMATLVVNAPDFASRATTPSAALWPQVISIPMTFGLVCFIGIIVSSSSQTIYGEAVWSPIDLLGKFLDNNPSSATRFGVWFISFSFIIAQITEYFLIRRGHYRVADLYITRRDGWYWYNYGFNWRAYTAYIAGILINVVGFAGATGRTVPIAATRIYQMSFFTGFGVSSIIYYALNMVSPVLGKHTTFEEMDMSEGEVDKDRDDGDSSKESESRFETKSV
ncbi:uracil permease [Marasmius crinis-equi]|uniref:Uracil permease n=1 Tax=Marasmius crinis-equi TaxID=585013 RepID=A0ABR3FGD1_9AGAR